jgi:hypothetical protein
MGKMRNAYKISVGKCEVVNWIQIDQERMQQT